jgi:PAS domain S-box-containing protein
MQTFYKKFSIIGGFGLLLVVLVMNAWVTMRQLATQTETAYWLGHTRQVLLELSQTESLLKDAETGQRGYLFTGDPKYLEPYTAAIGQIDSHLDRVMDLTRDNPTQQARIPTLRVLVHAKMAELARTIALYQAGQPDAAKAEVQTDHGLQYMTGIRATILELEKEETSLEAARDEAYQQSIRRTVASIYVATAMAGIGLVLLAYFILREIALREQHARDVRAREEWFRVTLTSIGDAVIATDKEGNVTFLNPIASTLTGVDLQDAMGRNINDVFPIFNETTGNTVENPVNKVIEQGRVVGLANHTVLKNREGHLIPIEDSAAPIRNDRKELLGVVLVFRDVTAERKSQEVLRKTEKLAAAARLSATVAHEINNPLEAVGNLIFIAKTTPETPPPVIHQLTMAEQELERVAHITRQTLGFFRDSKAPEPILMPALVEEVLALYSNKMKTKNITVKFDFEDCPPVIGMSSEMKQVLSNLVANAADAVPPNGIITVKLRCDKSNGEEAVEMVVEDNGPGIPGELADSIFEPFFTTKQDVGTGLGLWIAREIVERHGGSLQLETDRKEHVGTAFKIVLPCVPAGTAAQRTNGSTNGLHAGPTA